MRLLRNAGAFLALAVASACAGGAQERQATGPGGPPATNIQRGAPAAGMQTLFEVRMQPQPQTAPAFEAKGASMARPAAALESAQPGRRASFDTSELARFGGDYAQPGAAARVTQAGDSAVLSPDWSGPDSSLAGLAYCTFSFQLGDYAASGNLQTVGLQWDEGAAPADFDDLWLGLANWPEGCWDWYAGPADGVLTLDSLAPYTNALGEAQALVALTGTASATLRRIRIGDSELRATGAIPQPSGPDAEPLLHVGALPADFDLADACAPVGDQGLAASSTAFACAGGAYSFELLRNYGGLGWDFSGLADQLSTRLLYTDSGAQQGFACPRQGRHIDGVLETLRTTGCAVEAHAPYASYCDSEWTSEAAADALLLRIDGSRRIECGTPDSVPQMKAVLALQQHPLIVETAVDRPFFSYTAGNVWAYSGPALGWQALCIVGYDDALQAFKARNSWGAQWGDAGHVWIAYGDFAADKGASTHCWQLWDAYSEAAAVRFCGSGAAFETPDGLSAGDGASSSSISLEWTPTAGCTGYNVYRDSISNLVQTIGDGAADGWEDDTVGDLLAHVYWVQAVYAGGESALSAQDSGYLAPTPEIVGVEPLAGMAGTQITLNAEVFGAEPLDYSWDFGGGAAPNTSSEAAPSVTLGEYGEYAATLEVGNAHGQDSYAFTLNVTDDLFRLQRVTTTKYTHKKDGSEAPALLTAVTSFPADSYEWSSSQDPQPAADGDSASWQPDGGTPLGTVTITCQATSGGDTQEKSIKLSVTGQGIQFQFSGEEIGDNGHWPDFFRPSSKNPDGENFSDYAAGNVVVYMMTEIWCAPGRINPPDLLGWAQTYGPDGYCSVMHMSTESLATTQGWLETHGATPAPFPDTRPWIDDNFILFNASVAGTGSQWDGDPVWNEFWSDYGGPGKSLPRFILFDRDGNARRAQIGTLQGVELAQWESSIIELLGTGAAP